jgi:glucokinase-like ROK family protein
MQTGSFRWMKSLNKSTILNIIRLHGPISRAEIAKMTRLTPPTVTNIVSELLKDQLIVESNLGMSTGGRKPIMLKINSSGFYVIGIYARAKKLDAAVANLDGKIVYECSRALPDDPEEKVFLQELKLISEDALAFIHHHEQQALGIGIGMHGLVDPLQGESIYAPHLHLRRVPIKKYLETELNMLVEIENDVRALALAESWFGQGRDLANFISVNISSGIGAGIILDHELYHGASYSAGEIGHNTIDIHGPLCSCGNYGCLEALASGPAMVERTKQAIQQGRKSKLFDKLEGNLDELTGEAIYEAALDGDLLAIDVLADTGRFLGVGLANLINTFNPSRIILHGGVTRAGRFIIDPLLETVRSRALERPAEQVSIVVSQLGKRATLIGAFTLVLKKIFAPTPADGSG